MRKVVDMPFFSRYASSVVVLAAMAMLQGLSREELETNELEYLDPDYPVVIAARAVKSGRTA